MISFFRRNKVLTIAIAVILAVLILLLCYLLFWRPKAFSEDRQQAWTSYFGSVSEPQQTVFASKGREYEKMNDGKRYLCYYWIVESELTVGEIQGYFDVHRQKGEELLELKENTVKLEAVSMAGAEVMLLDSVKMNVDIEKYKVLSQKEPNFYLVVVYVAER